MRSLRQFVLLLVGFSYHIALVWVEAAGNEAPNALSETTLTTLLLSINHSARTQTRTTTAADDVQTSFLSSKGSISASPKRDTTLDFTSESGTQPDGSTITPTTSTDSKIAASNARASFTSLISAHSGLSSEHTTATPTFASNISDSTTDSSSATTLSNVTTSISASEFTHSTNSVTPAASSPQSTVPATADTYQGPQHCLYGSECALKLGVGLGFGSVLIAAAIFVIARKYREHVQASHLEHQRNWNNRDRTTDNIDLSEAHQISMKTMDIQESGTLVWHERRIDELYLPDDVQRVVDKVADTRQQSVPLAAESHGSVRRMTLPTYGC